MPSGTTLAIAINRLLGRVGYQIVKSSTLDGLIASAANPAPIPVPVDGASTEMVAALERRIAAMEAKSDDESIKNVIKYAMKAHWRAVDLIDQLSAADKPTACALCGHVADKIAFEPVESECRFFGGRLLRHRCPSCEAIFGPQKMLALDEEMVDLDYRNLYRIYSESATTDSIIRTFHLLAPRRDGIYLDFGCGGEWSEAIARLRSEGWNIYGFEPSATNSSEFVFSNWAEVEARRFDGILSHNVLEHLFDPIGTTRRLRDVLQPSGRLVHATPCFDYLYEFSHYHVFFFTGRSPEVLAERSGMAIREWVRDGEYIACVLEAG
jgi:2-polyprenyl-3-methyl-5-hydroxy-6-metoxy-1,4-benzoquinol methylase